MPGTPKTMNDDWPRIEELFHEAIELPAGERAEYLTRVCEGDARLRSEVEAYLAAYEASPEMMEEPAAGLGLRLLSKLASRPSFEGKQFGSYRVLKQLGEGGMGEVYLAEDVQLGRQVALKFLSPKLVNDAWAKRQLRKEAQAVAKLDHPNVCGVHGFEEFDGHSFIVMQYIEGETLYSFMQRERMPPGRVPLVASQIASALAEAHAREIIHRDIKPKNIMLSASGNVKVLDFGLAKSVRKSPLNGAAGESRGSSLGLVVGTVKYMSPEQLKAEKLDFRSDIFSFGIVLYEMITGRNPFAKNSDAESITAILNSDVPSETDGPKGLLQIARKCLVADRDRRYQSVNEILLDIDDHLRGKKTFRRRPIPGRLRTRVALAALLLLVIVSAIVYSNVTRVRTLAVLPIVNKSGDQTIDYLGDGLTDALIHRLSRLPRLKVRPRTQVARFNGSKVDPAEVGRALNVEMLFASEITKRGEQPVLEARLIRTKDGSLAWRETRDLVPNDLLALHQQICDKVAEAGLFYFRSSERGLMSAHQTQSPEAFQHYIMARSYWNNRTRESIPLAIEHYRKALELDADYAQSCAGLADCYAVRTTVAYGALPTKEALPIAKDYAFRALRLDNTNCEAHISLGVIALLYEWDFPEAEKQFKLAINLNPDNSQAHFWYSRLLALLGRKDESLVHCELARELEPMSTSTEMNLGASYYIARDYEKATDFFLKMIEKYPGDEGATYALGLVYLQRKMYSRAIEVFLPLYGVNKASVAAPLGLAYVKSGQPRQARKILSELEGIWAANKDRVPPQELAILHMALNEMDQAVVLFQQACADRFASFIFIKVDPLFDDLRSDPRYEDLLRCAHLTK
jgi:serine/threonine-protein kinase